MSLLRSGLRFAANLGNPQDWPPAKRCLMISTACVPVMIWASAVGHYWESHPENAPFLDLEVLGLVNRIHLWGFVGGWILLALGSWRAIRRGSDGRFVMKVLLQFAAAEVVFWVYVSGHFTDSLGWTAVLGATAGGLMVFERVPAFATITWGTVLLVAIAVAEQLGWIPYAPLLREAPIQNGSLSTWWLLSYGVTTWVFFLIAIGTLAFIVEQWRERERRLTETRSQLRRMNRLIHRYLPAAVADRSSRSRSPSVAGLESRVITVLMSDIRGSSEIAENHHPERVAGLIDAYRSLVVALAERRGGTVTQFAGDGVIVLFGAPGEMENRLQARSALQAAVEIQKAVGDLPWPEGAMNGAAPVRIGIETGLAAVGDFGLPERLEYGAIGRPVRVADDLQRECPLGEVQLGVGTRALLEIGEPVVDPKTFPPSGWPSRA